MCVVRFLLRLPRYSDFRDPTVHTLNIYFLQRIDALTENYNYVRYESAIPQAKLRRDKAPDYCTFALNFLGYDSTQIDARLPAESIGILIGQMPSIGLDNVSVVGNYLDGFLIEFINQQGGCAQPMLTGRVTTPTSGELIVNEATPGGVEVNAVQGIKLREGPLVTATGWTEIGVPATPGWTAALDTTSLPQSVWEDGTLVLEIGMDAVGIRTGADGVTVLEGASRSGIDGVMVADPALLEVTSLANRDDQGVCTLIARDGSAVYGRLFSLSDVGRILTDVNEFLLPGTVITKVSATPEYNAAVLSSGFAPHFINNPSVISFDIGVAPTKVFKSATAAFTSADVGHSITGDNLDFETTIAQVQDGQTVLLSKSPMASGSGLSWQIQAQPSKLFDSATGSFTSADVGARLEAPQLPLGCVIVARNSATQVVLSQKALSAATGQAWTLRPKVGFMPASVTVTQPGTMTAPEKQNVTFVQSPIGGFVTFQDSADASMPVATVKAPITAMDIQAALTAAYLNYGDLIVTEKVPNGQFEVLWGVNGKQHLLGVDDSGAIYQKRVAIVSVGAQENKTEVSSPNVPAVPGIVRYGYGGLFLMGVSNVNFKQIMNNPVKTRMTDGTESLEIRIRYAVIQTQYLVPDIGERIRYPPGGSQYRYHDRVENVEVKGGLLFYDWIGYMIPKPRVEMHQQNKAVYLVPIQSLNGRLVDMQIASVSQSTYIRHFFTYWVYGRINNANTNNGAAAPPDGPFGAIVHFSSIGGFTGQQFLWRSVGFGGPTATTAGTGTSGRNHTLGWARRKWRANIWEQVVYKG